ncbi:MAG: MarR family transcriptional regulator [Paracoccaceae bacterium]|jgi:DNA-binding MarR family transcriptional regulator
MNSDRPNSVNLDTHVPALLFALGAKISLHAQRENARKLGLDMCEWRTVQILGRDGPSTVIAVADRIAMDRGGTSRAVARLEKRGLVYRKPDLNDRRKSIVGLTEEGEHIHQNVVLFANERETQLLKDLSENERNELIKNLQTLTISIDQMLNGE